VEIESVAELQFSRQRVQARCAYWSSPQVLRAVKMSLVQDVEFATYSSAEVYGLVAFEAAK
jgi:hypothetical protein